MVFDPLSAQRGGVYLNTGPERVALGQPAAATVRAEAERLQARRVCLVSSASQAALANGPLQQIERALAARHAGSFGAMRAHSPREDVIAVARLAREVQADLLVAVGAGSVIDGCKAALMCLWHGLEWPAQFELFRQRGARAAQPVQAPGGALRMLAVPVGFSAAEFTSTAGVTDATSRTKQAFRHPLFVPRTVILDPAATLHTPLPLLMATGMRAVDHAIEGYCSARAHAAGEIHSLAGLQLLAQALPAILREPTELAPRQAAQLGMWQAILGAASGAGTGASHGIGYALGATFDVAHGHTSCVLLPAVLRYNEPFNEDRQQVLAAAMGLPGVPLADAVAALVQALGLPGSLQAVGVGPEHWPELARRALAYEPVQRNPRPIRDADDVMEILRAAGGA